MTNREPKVPAERAGTGLSDAARDNFNAWFKVYSDGAPNPFYDRAVAWPAYCAGYAAARASGAGGP